MLFSKVSKKDGKKCKKKSNSYSTRYLIVLTVEKKIAFCSPSFLSKIYTKFLGIQ